MSWYNRIPFRIYLLIGVGIVAIFALVLFLMGQVLICECGYVKFWHGITPSAEGSQHLTDWYTFSHVIHGFGFYALLWLIARLTGWPLPLGLRLVLALFLETGWEIIENTDWVINYYRANTVSFDYYGDSVINSVADVLFMVVGFALAAILPVWTIVALTVFLELFVLYFIRDNLTLNILMFLYPLEAIVEWQRGV